MEPSPAKKQKIDLRQLTPEDSDAMRKLMGNMEKHLKVKNQTLGELQMELRDVKEMVKRDPSLRILFKEFVSNSHWTKLRKSSPSSEGFWTPKKILNQDLVARFTKPTSQGMPSSKLSIPLSRCSSTERL
jgi:hypothetical protein